MPVFKQLKFSLSLPLGVGGIEGTWEPDDVERKAAWEMYVELITRVTIVELRPRQGLNREALQSLHSLFQTTRDILRSYGPRIAQPKGSGDYSFGFLAAVILNDVLRPVLTEWHPRLEDWEAGRPQGLSRTEHEKSWEHTPELRKALSDIREPLIAYADLLAAVSEVPRLHKDALEARHL
ncbi:hypothetical protein [Miltoncostaea oceani]|uniref:hypothetical protein n=1 Tax=Miltoncostaea oceani TaxID=2843216 RepID=UPI001C3DFC2D|nr:hypothetical protein [Miltoncostaea oceani]